MTRPRGRAGRSEAASGDDPLGPVVPRPAVASAQATRIAFGEALVDLGARDPRVVVLDGDLANSTKVDGFADAFPERFFEMGIAEQNMIGVAAGLATAGLVPFATTFAAFAAYRDLDQVRVVVAQSRLHVVIVGGYAGLLIGKAGKSHVCLEDVAIMRALPNMTVLAPGDGVEARQVVARAAEHSGPVYVRLGRDLTPDLFDESYEFAIGRPVLLRDGRDVALLTTGLQAARTLAAADLLAAEGIEALVLHLPTVKPLPEDAVVEAARRTGAVVTAEDHSIVGGLGSAVAETLGERHPTALRRIGTRDTYAESGPNDALLEKYGLTARHVADAARALLEARR
jgi:transketolase